MSTTVVFDATAHPVHSVTVFQVNRADINRRIEVDLKQGQNEVEIKNLPSALLSDSIRVDGIGQAVIFDVIYKAPQDKDDDSDDDDTTGLATLRHKRAAVQRKVDTLDKQLTVLSGYAGSVKSEHTSSTQLSEFLDTYSIKLVSLNEEKVVLYDDLKQVDKDIRAAEKEHQKDEESAKRGVKIVVVVLAERDGPAELSLSYAVENASWTPLYDVRALIDGGQKKEAKSKVSLHYRASITQSTAEDWNNVHLTLSTASPHTGSEIPKLVANRLREYVPPRFSNKGAPKSSKRRKAIPQMEKEMSRADSDDEGGGGPGSAFGSMVPKLFSLRKVRASDSGQGFSSVFDIEGLSTIPSNADSDETHKVTIAVLDLQDVSLKWIAVPKEIPSVFLQCQVRNTSEYTLLPGDSSVFMNDNFVSKSTIPNVSPQETFLTSLGVDPSVRIAFTPPSQKVNNISGGLLSSKTTTTTFSQRITVKNTRLITVEPLIVRDQFPVSDDSRIKVTLVQPQLPDPSTPTPVSTKEVGIANVKGGVVKARWQAANEDAEVVEANDQGFVEWACQIQPSASLDLITVWEVNVPKGLKWNQ